MYPYHIKIIKQIGEMYSPQSRTRYLPACNLNHYAIACRDIFEREKTILSCCVLNSTVSIQEILLDYGPYILKLSNIFFPYINFIFPYVN
jgi:hypothetical protein